MVETELHFLKDASRYDEKQKQQGRNFEHATGTESNR